MNAADRWERRVQLGPHLTQGLGAGAKPEMASSTSSRLGLADNGLPINTAISAS